MGGRACSQCLRIRAHCQGNLYLPASTLVLALIFPTHIESWLPMLTVPLTTRRPTSTYLHLHTHTHTHTRQPSPLRLPHAGSLIDVEFPFLLAARPERAQLDAAAGLLPRVRLVARIGVAVDFLGLSFGGVFDSVFSFSLATQ